MDFKLIVFFKLGVERTELSLGPKRNLFERLLLSGDGKCAEFTSRPVAGDEVPGRAMRYPRLRRDAPGPLCN